MENKSGHVICSLFTGNVNQEELDDYLLYLDSVFTGVLKRTICATFSVLPTTSKGIDDS